MSKYLPIIGLEVHVELKTKSKMFCACSTDYFGQQPNTHVCPVCLGLPGALPVPNKTAIDWCVKIALALRCKINEFSKFDRKNYFYPDLPKGYQISQYDLPFGEKGYIELANKKRIGITRVHMEEDTGKLTHQEVHGEKASLIDFNRSSVPLVEIVTEPDFHDATEVKEYLQKLHQIVQYLDVSNADMEKGEMRLEPNISLANVPEKGAKVKLPPYKVEVKNINSFKFVEKAINFELKRQEKILEKGERPVQETRGWDENKQQTFSQRVKEEAQDYRYFPDPDIPPIRITKDQLQAITRAMPELPDAKIERLQKEYGLPFYDAEILCRDKTVADYFEEAIQLAKKERVAVSAKDLANAIINKKVDLVNTPPAGLVKAVLSAKQVVTIDEQELIAIIKKVLADNAKAVEDYKNGKQASLMFLLGQVMRAVGKKIDVNLVRDTIQKLL
jgi:aspartyl-tRNA(Asn)/glutamyl-tRNA(Gln) amidotransferase subunit B